MVMSPHNGTVLELLGAGKPQLFSVNLQARGLYDLAAPQEQVGMAKKNHGKKRGGQSRRQDVGKETPPSTTDTDFFQRGLSALRKNDHGQALACFGKALEIDPENGAAHAWMANTLLNQGDSDQAEEHAQRAVNLGSRELGLNALAEVYLKRGDIKKAETILDQCLGEFPQSARSSFNRGIAFWKAGRRLQAKPYLQKAAELEPSNAQYADTLRKALDDMGRQPTISLCMMVKNEEHNLRRCLESAQGIFDEIVVVDTGSEDKTMDIAREYSARLYERPWFNDFSGMRNITIGYAQGDWIFILDADEEIDSNDKQLIRNAAMQTEYNGVTVVVHNYTKNGARDSKGSSIRMFRSNRGFRYEGIVHNDLNITQPFLNTRISIHHYGYDLDKEGVEKKFERTGTLLRKMIDNDPHDYKPHFYLMKSLASVRDFKGAVKEGEETLRIVRDNHINLDGSHFFELYYLLSGYNANIGSIGEAERYILLGLEINDQHPDLHYALSRLKAHNRDFDASARSALLALENFSQYERGKLVFASLVNCSRWEILLSLAQAEYELSHYEDARRYCDEILNDREDSAAALLLRAKIDLKESQFTPALELLEKARGLDNKNHDILYNLGRCHLGLEDYAQAYGYFRQTIALAPYFAAAFHYLGRIDLRRGEFQKAETSLKQAAELDPMNMEYLNDLALVLEHNNGPAEALGVFEKMAGIDPAMAGLNKKIGELAFSLGDYPKATTCFERELAYFPESAPALNNLAVAHAAQGDLEQALLYFQRCLELDPANGMASENITILKARLAERNRAQAAG